jgi:hypothetical protein
VGGIEMTRQVAGNGDHHINHNKPDNRIENLKILSKRDHAFGHYGKNELISEIKRLQARIEQLESELRDKS